MALSRPVAPSQTQPAYLSSTQDLLARFSLLPAYDRYVRPFVSPVDKRPDQNGSVPTVSGANGALDKGKGKEVVGTPGSVAAADGGEGEDEEGAGGRDKKKKNNYKHLIKGVPGMFYVLL